MSEGKHVWHFYEESKDGCFCVKGCRGRLSRKEAEAILNEHAELARENGIRKTWTEELSAVNLKWAKVIAKHNALLKEQEQ